MAIAKKLTKHVTLTGLTEVLFNRYAGDNNTKLTPDQKLYLDEKRQVCFPTLNLISFLSAQNTESAPKLCLDKRIYKSICSAMLASTSIAPTSMIPFTRKGKPVVFGEFNEEGIDKQSGIRVLRHVARLEKGIPNPVERPALATPWQLDFDITIMPHPDLTEDMVAGLFRDGGVRLGIGAFRKMFGKFDFKWS